MPNYTTQEAPSGPNSATNGRRRGVNESRKSNPGLVPSRNPPSSAIAPTNAQALSAGIARGRERVVARLIVVFCFFGEGLSEELTQNAHSHSEGSRPGWLVLTPTTAPVPLIDTLLHVLFRAWKASPVVLEKTPAPCQDCRNRH